MFNPSFDINTLVLVTCNIHNDTLKINKYMQIITKDVTSMCPCGCGIWGVTFVADVWTFEV